MRCPTLVSSRRRVLCVFPAYTPSFGTFSHAYRLLPRVRAFMPPQGLLLIAAYLPPSWLVRFIDENITPATAGDFAWADFVFVSGMHIKHHKSMTSQGERNEPASSLSSAARPFPARPSSIQSLTICILVKSAMVPTVLSLPLIKA